jgi:hypothetical protein
MAGDTTQVATHFFTAARTLACHTGSLQERLADAYADHLLTVTMSDLPPELQPSFRELEERLNRGPEADADSDDDEDPFQVAARALTDADARELIDTILLLYGRLMESVRSP